MSKRPAPLPIGRTARIAYEIDAMRQACCRAAAVTMNRGPLDEEELEECARLDDALAAAQRILKTTVRDVMMMRLARRSQGMH
jgi:hypothetical protein